MRLKGQILGKGKFENRLQSYGGETTVARVLFCVWKAEVFRFFLFTQPGLPPLSRPTVISVGQYWPITASSESAYISSISTNILKKTCFKEDNDEKDAEGDLQLLHFM